MVSSGITQGRLKDVHFKSSAPPQSGAKHRLQKVGHLPHQPYIIKTMRNLQTDDILYKLNQNMKFFKFFILPHVSHLTMWKV